MVGFREFYKRFLRESSQKDNRQVRKTNLYMFKSIAGDKRHFVAPESFFMERGIHNFGGMNIFAKCWKHKGGGYMTYGYSLRHGDQIPQAMKIAPIVIKWESNDYMAHGATNDKGEALDPVPYKKS